MSHTLIAMNWLWMTLLFTVHDISVVVVVSMEHTYVPTVTRILPLLSGGSCLT